MAASGIQVEGLRDFAKDLRRVDTRLAKSLQAANKKVAVKVAEKVKRPAQSTPAPGSGRIAGGITGRARQARATVAFSAARRSQPLLATVLGADWHKVWGRPIPADEMARRVWQPHLGSRWSPGDLYGVGPVFVRESNTFVMAEYEKAIMAAFAEAFPDRG